MLKFIAAAIWICVITVGAVFYSFQAAGERGAGQPPKPLLGGLDYVKTDIISVPLVRDSAVQGYFLTNLVYTVDPAQIKKLSVPAPALITDQIYSYLYQNPQIDLPRWRSSTSMPSARTSAIPSTAVSASNSSTRC